MANIRKAVVTATDSHDFERRYATLAREALLFDEVRASTRFVTAAGANAVTTDDFTVFVDTTAGAVTLNLPNVERGRIFVVMKHNAAAAAITITPAAGTIGPPVGATLVFGAGVTGSRVIQFDGTNWWVIASA